jgi:hypothetical protein
MLLCLLVSVAGALGCGVEDNLDTDHTLQTPLTHEEPATSCEEGCMGGLTCVAGTCQPCSSHSQCQSDVCDQGAATSMGPGFCVAELAVVYVDAGAYPACMTGDGSRANPVCQINDAFPLASGVRYAVRVYAGHYRPVRVTGRTVFVFGPGDGSAVVGEEDISTGARITGGANVVLDGLDFGGHVLAGVVCDGSCLKVLRGTVQGDYDGIRSTDCNLELDRVRVGGGGRSGLTVGGTGTYYVSNSYFSGWDAQAVVLGGSTTGTFRFNTVAGGGELSPGGIDCGTSPRTISDSIVVYNHPAAGGAQTVGSCVHRRVVVGSGDTRTLPGLIKLDPVIDERGRLPWYLANEACCIDRGDSYASSLYRDFYGTPRRQNGRNDIGAHEVIQEL